MPVINYKPGQWRSGILTRENVIEFLFSNKKFKVEKFLLIILFWLGVLYLSAAFELSITILFVPLLTLFLVISIIKIMWYNKKRKIKTLVIEKLEPILHILVIVAFLLIDT